MGREDYRYPIAPHLLSHWRRAERTGELVLPVGETGRVLRIEYVEYEPPSYFLGRHFLGRVLLDEQPLRVHEQYRYHTEGNSGSVRWMGEATSDQGLCACSEIVMAHDAGRALVWQQETPGVWRLALRHKVDQSFHELEYDDYRVSGRLELERRELHLERSYFRDSST